MPSEALRVGSEERVGSVAVGLPWLVSAGESVSVPSVGLGTSVSAGSVGVSEGHGKIDSKSLGNAGGAVAPGPKCSTR